jgi:ABC-type transport system involved in multi-copper enzyme maturation permease subunit
MKELLQAEWIKMTHRWMPRIILSVLALIVILFLLLTALASHANTANAYWPRGLLFGMLAMFYFSGLCMTVLGGAWSGSEYSSGSIRMILTARPNRYEQFLAGLIILIAFAMVAIAMSLVLGVIFAVFGQGANVPSDFILILIKSILAVLLSMTLYAAVAYTAGAVFRSPVGGIATGIGLWIFELIFGGILLALGGIGATIEKHFPYQYASALPQDVMSPAILGNLMQGSSGPTAGEALMGVLVYLVVVLAIGLFVVSHRDVTD